MMEYGDYTRVSRMDWDEYDAFVGCGRAQGELENAEVLLDELLCVNSADEHIYRRPLATLLADDNDACVDAVIAPEIRTVSNVVMICLTAVDVRRVSSLLHSLRAS